MNATCPRPLYGQITCISTIQFIMIANLTLEPNVNTVFITLNMTFDLLLTSNCKNNTNNGLLITSLAKNMISRDLLVNWFKKLFFYWRRQPSWPPSWTSRIAQGYPLDIRYRGPKDIKPSEKKLSVGAGLGPKISFGNMTIMCDDTVALI